MRIGSKGAADAGCELITAASESNLAARLPSSESSRRREPHPRCVVLGRRGRDTVSQRVLLRPWPVTHAAQELRLREPQRCVPARRRRLRETLLDGRTALWQVVVLSENARKQQQRAAVRAAARVQALADALLGAVRVTEG